MLGDLFGTSVQGYAEGGEAVQHGDADLQLCDLTIEVPRAQALALPTPPRCSQGIDDLLH